MEMSKAPLATLCQYLADQAYMNHLLVKQLEALGLLKPGELQRRSEANSLEKETFLRDFLAYLASVGLGGQ